MPSDRRYERFGFDYDVFNPPDPKAIGWPLRFAEETGGPVLELACGGGTLLLPLARAGLEVTGVDLSQAMLERARTRLAGEPPEVRARVTLVCRDMAGLDLGRVFALVLLADNSVRELETKEEIRACFSSVRRHLAPGGTFLLTASRFRGERYSDGPRDLPYSAEIEDPRTGAMVSRRIHVKWERKERRLRGSMVYRVRERDGSEHVEECPWVTPVVEPEEFREMLAGTGFTSRLVTGYEEKPDDGEDPVLCFVATAV